MMSQGKGRERGRTLVTTPPLTCVPLPWDWESGTMDSGRRRSGASGAGR